MKRSFMNLYHEAFERGLFLETQWWQLEKIVAGATTGTSKTLDRVNEKPWFGRLWLDGQIGWLWIWIWIWSRQDWESPVLISKLFMSFDESYVASESIYDLGTRVGRCSDTGRDASASLDGICMYACSLLIITNWIRHCTCDSKSERLISPFLVIDRKFKNLIIRSSLWIAV